MSAIELLTYLYTIPALIVFLVAAFMLKTIEVINDESFSKNVKPHFSYKNVVMCALAPLVNIVMALRMLYILCRDARDFINLYRTKK